MEVTPPVPTPTLILLPRVNLADLLPVVVDPSDLVVSSSMCTIAGTTTTSLTVRRTRNATTPPVLRVPLLVVRPVLPQVPARAVMAVDLTRNILDITVLTMVVIIVRILALLQALRLPLHPLQVQAAHPVPPLVPAVLPLVPLLAALLPALQAVLPPPHLALPPPLPPPLHLVLK
jgi:hypothetical protein